LWQTIFNGGALLKKNGKMVSSYRIIYFVPMKYLLFFALVLVAGCKQDPDEKVKDAVKKYFKAELDDPGSYQPGEFEITPVTTEIPEHKRELDSLIRLMGENKITPRQLSEQDSMLTKKYEDKMLQGWNVTHAYRAKNKFGALVGEEADLFVDRQYNIQVKEVR
jgi:hypothetical protein